MQPSTLPGAPTTLPPFPWGASPMAGPSSPPRPLRSQHLCSMLSPPAHGAPGTANVPRAASKIWRPHELGGGPTQGRNRAAPCTAALKSQKFSESRSSRESRISAASASQDTGPPGAPLSVLPPFSFPGVPPALQGFMEGLMAQVEGAIGEQLLPCNTPSDVTRFEAPGGSKGFIQLFPGKDRRKVDKVLLSWLLCKLPGGAALGLSTLAVLMGPATDTPHLLLEFTFARTPSGPPPGAGGGPPSAPAAAPASGSQAKGSGAGEEPPLEFDRVIGVVDLLPRRDLVMHPEYLQRVYSDTGVEGLRKQVKASAGMTPYEAPTEYVRALLSPCALNFSAAAEPGSDGSSLMGAFQPLADQVAGTWVKCVKGVGEPVSEGEIAAMEARDAKLFEFGIEADLVRNLPRIYGDDITERVVQAIRKT